MKLRINKNIFEAIVDDPTIKKKLTAERKICLR